VTNLNAGQSLAVSLGFSLANCAESVIAAWLLVHYLGTPLTMTRLRDIIGLGGLAVIASNACTALLGAIVVSLSLGSPFWTVWRIWWIADGLGMLVITPTIVTWVTVGRSLFKTYTVGRIVEAVCLYAALAVITQGVFGARPDIAHVPFPSPLVSLPYVLFPFLFWAALRFGLPGATTASVIVAAEALWNTAHGLGPFVGTRGTVTDHVLAAQVFLSVAVFSALVAAAVAAEWQCSEQALRDSETRFRTMAETMPIPVVIGRLTDGSILYANAACRALVDVLPAAPGSRKTTDFFADPAERQQILEALRNQGSIHNYEIRIKKADGTPRWVLSSSQIGTFNGEPAVLSGLYDLTERKRMEEELRRSEKLLKDLINNTSAIIHIKSAEGRYLLVNTQFETVYHTTNEQMIGKTAHDVLPRELADRLHAIDMQVLQSRQAVHKEEYAQRPDGRHTYIVLKFPLLDASGMPYAICGISTDITERKEMEEALRRTATDLAHSNADLEQFAYVASHDLQEPLRAIAGCLQLLQQRYIERLDTRGAEYIRHAVEGAGRMRTLIQDLLAYSRVTTHGDALTPTDCTTVLKQALANLKVAIEESSAVVTHPPLPTVPGDATQLLQVFQNLVGNAIKFRAAAPPAIHISAECHEDAWRFAVRDNGIGIEPQYAERIFVLFQRLHTRVEYPGTGIGLALCQKIVERHGGRIWVESALGQGATFFFTIPRRA
jgi:PAS domain S-box-containing protein